MSFHPSSPVLLEFSTEYLTPSGPTSSPLCGTVNGRGRPTGRVDARIGLLPIALARCPIPGRCSGSLVGGRRPRHPVGGRRVEAVVDRWRGYHHDPASPAGRSAPRAQDRSGSGSGRRTTGWCPAERTVWGRGTPVASRRVYRGHRHTEGCVRRARRWRECPAGSCSMFRTASAPGWYPPENATEMPGESRSGTAGAG